MPRRSIWSARQRTAPFDLPKDEAALLRHYTLSDDIEHVRVRRGGHNWLSFAPFDIRVASGGRGGFLPERPSIHCRTARHARRRPRWQCGAGGDPEGAPRRDPAHPWLPDVIGT